MKIRNAVPRMYYGLHFQSGVAEYKEMDGKPMIYINPDTAKAMDRSFQGKPVFVNHADNVDFSNVQEADGVVVRSFYNKADGNHWAEFLVYTDEGIRSIEAGWKLSNAYEVTQERGSGSWHGVEYDREVADGIYEHLAIVSNPRYADSIILNADEFKQYNIDKESDLIRLANSQGEKTMFKLFKRKTVKVENSDELASMSVVLPKSKVEKTITQLVNEADESEGKKGIANEEDMVDLENDDSISVKDLTNFYKKNYKSDDDDDLKNDDDDDDLKNDDDEIENKDEDDKEIRGSHKKKNMKKNSKKKKIGNALEIAEKKAELAEERYEKLKNAHNTSETIVNSVDLSEDKIARGKKRYGSN